MQFTDDDLNEIERLSGLFFKVSEIATIVGVDADDLEWELDDTDSPAARAYSRGRLLAEAEIRKSVITLAKQGSSPAQNIVLRLIEQQR